MIVLDTNVVSEAMRIEPNPAVLAWLNSQSADTLFLSTVTMAELLFGISALPAGKRRKKLEQVFDGLIGLFNQRILAFDTDAARHYAALAIKAKSAGRGFPTADGYIAAIAASRGFSVATRDTEPFHAAGVLVIDPWKS